MTHEEAQNWIRCHLNVSRETWGKLEEFAAYLTHEAQSQNLIAASTLEHIWARHIVDSAQLLPFAEAHGWTNWLDLGSGAGFPGIIIGILTDRPVTLVESRTRRVDYLGRAVKMLKLEKNVTIVGSTIEKVKTKQYSVISARAFAPLPRLLDSAARFSTENTLWLLPKGRNAAAELSDIENNWRHDFNIEPSVTDPEAGILVGKLGGYRAAKTD